jgi:nitrogen fixation-related uncharacterized protein
MIVVAVIIIVLGVVALYWLMKSMRMRFVAFEINKDETHSMLIKRMYRHSVLVLN